VPQLGPYPKNTLSFEDGSSADIRRLNVETERFDGLDDELDFRPALSDFLSSLFARFCASFCGRGFFAFATWRYSASARRIAEHSHYGCQTSNV
jgi:hypothetical protein